MAFTYNPKDAKNSWDDGDYDAEIVAVEETVSKSSGNDMLKLTVKAYNAEGREQTLYDYITAGAIFKLKQIADALGKGAEFKAGTFDPLSMKGRRLTVALVTEESGDFGDRNKVKKYLGSKSAIGGTRSSPIVNAIRDQTKARQAAMNSPISDEAEFDPASIPF